jgi:hypothetical protein
MFGTSRHQAASASDGFTEQRCQAGVRNPAQNVIPRIQDQAAFRPIGNPAGRQEAWANEHACIGKEIDMIQVRRTAEHDSFIFEVVVREGNGETRHHVTMPREMCERLTAGKHTPERCLEAAFRFLLEREPKESILRRFDVMVISRYFPDFERKMPRYLSQF